ncbi:hypothetical protein Bbelb_310110 [Branchiostoma belcheri]|nr:hypothetical protein Bbelb_310110 [Branchiostoma belcheri]
MKPNVSVVDSSPTPYTALLQLSTTLGSPQGATSLRLSYATPSPLYPMLNTGSHVVTAAGALSEGPAVGWGTNAVKKQKGKSSSADASGHGPSPAGRRGCL